MNGNYSSKLLILHSIRVAYCATLSLNLPHKVLYTSNVQKLQVLNICLCIMPSSYLLKACLVALYRKLYTVAIARPLCRVLPAQNFD